MAKLTGEERKKFLRERLDEQHHLLKKSIKDFTSGDLAEGVRLAIALRILIHETGNSKALLGQITPNYLQLQIPDRRKENEAKEKLPPGTHSVVVMSVPISVKITAEGTFLDPHLDPAGYELSIVGKWWTRDDCLILPGLGGFSRKEIVLGLADKEGGAHVDINLAPKYRQLTSSKQLQVGCGEEKVTPLNLSRFLSAQVAVEMLDCLDRHFPL